MQSSDQVARSIVNEPGIYSQSRSRSCSRSPSQLPDQSPTQCSTQPNESIGFLDNLYLVAPLIFFISLIFGIVFYMVENGWNFPLAYYFASSVLIGSMYLVPSEANPNSQIFTQLYFLWGTTLLMGAIAAMANELLANAVRVAADERRRILSQLEPQDTDGDGIISWSEYLTFYCERLLNRIGWPAHRIKYIAVSIACVWFGLGVVYGICYEGWSLSTSAFFALAAMSASGSMPPACTGGVDLFTCSIGSMRALLIGSYILLGVPIFTFTMGQFAELLVERAVRVRERHLMLRPLSDHEFRFGCALQGGLRSGIGYSFDDDDSHGTMSKDVKLDLGDFVVLELLRLKKITAEDLEHMKSLFDLLDADGDGVLIRPAPIAVADTRKLFHDGNSLDARTQVLLACRKEPFLSPIQEGSHPSAKDCTESDHGSPLQDEEEDISDLAGISAGYNQLVIPMLTQMSIQRLDSLPRSFSRARSRSAIYSSQTQTQTPFDKCRRNSDRSKDSSEDTPLLASASIGSQEV
jgi:hypothetical protein